MKIFIQPYRIAGFFLKHKKEDCNFFLLLFYYCIVLYYIVFVFYFWIKCKDKSSFFILRLRISKFLFLRPHK